MSNAHRADGFVTYTQLPDGNIGSIFDDVRVPVENELVVGADSFKQAITTYNVNRVTSMAVSWIMARWLFNEALEYAQQREQFGQPIGEFQGISHQLADMAAKLETSWYLISVPSPGVSSPDGCSPQ